LISIPKKTLFKGHFKRSLLLKFTNPASQLAPVTCIVSIVALPIIFSLFKSPLSGKLTFIYYLLNTLLVILLFKSYSNNKNSLELQKQKVQEEWNIISEQGTKDLKNQRVFNERIGRFALLKDIIEDVAGDLRLESVVETILETAFTSIGKKRGNCLLYLIDHQRQRLVVFGSRKQDRNLIIKTKEGDIFDSWVQRHTSSLLIEDTRRDFRFDPERIAGRKSRVISSLISAPIKTEHRLLGILRLESPETSVYSQEDLRFLMTVCDLGAIALENARLFEKTQELAIHDGLTGLFTKGHFLEHFEAEYARALRDKGELSLLMMDIDFFKIYNDKYGHRVGDIVLKSIGKLATEFFRSCDATVGRFGGEEFCIALANITEDKAYRLAVDFCKKVKENKVVLRREDTGVTVSIGLASLSQKSSDAQELVFAADQALLEAKRRGKNRVVKDKN